MSESTTVTERFAGRTVIVTGAGSGIGLATAVRLGREGARVVAADISGERLDALVADHPDLDLVTVTGDVTSQADVDAVVAAADGRVDGLANVAGIMDGFLPPAEVDDETWERVLSVNLTAPMRLTRAVLPLMIEAGAGAIVNVSSEAGVRVSAAGVAYAASKHAVNALTKSTAFYYKGKGVRANAVLPGAVSTNIEGSMRSELAQEVVAPLFAHIPSLATPEELAAAITWLLSDDSANVNGVLLLSDGGWSTV